MREFTVVLRRFTVVLRRSSAALKFMSSALRNDPNIQYPTVAAAGRDEWLIINLQIVDDEQ